MSHLLTVQGVTACVVGSHGYSVGVVTLSNGMNNEV